MNIIKFTGLAAALGAGIVFSPLALATNGYFAHGYGTKNKGLAGSGGSLAQDAMIVATNPAGSVFIGERMDIGISSFSPNPRGYKDDNPAAGFVSGPAGFGQESEDDIFFIPHFAYNWALDSNQSIGVAVYGNGGMNTEYKTGVYAGGAGGTTGVNLEQLFITPTYSRKINDNSSWGISAILAYQRFEAKGFSVFQGFSLSPNNLSNNGVDTSSGYGARLGWMGDVGGGVTLSASYQSEIQMGEFDKYSGLFAENGDFNIPSSYNVGLAWSIDPKSSLTFDIQKINYSDIPAIANPLSPLATNCTPGAPATGSGCLGGSNGAGFGWEDMTVFKLGYQWQASPKWTWRAGISHGEQPIPESEVLFNIVAPAVIETHITFGFTHTMSKTSEINFAAMYAPENEVTGTVDTTSIGGGVDNVTLEMTQYELEVSWGLKF